MKGKPIHRIVECDGLAPARGILQLVDICRAGFFWQDLARALQLVESVDSECRPAEFGLGGLFDAEDKRLDAVATVVGTRPVAFGLKEAKVLHELAGGVYILGFVLVVDVGDAGELNLLRCVSHGERMVGDGLDKMDRVFW